MFVESGYQCKTCDSGLGGIHETEEACDKDCYCSHPRIVLVHKCGQCRQISRSFNKALLCCSDYRLVKGKRLVRKIEATQ